MRRFELGNNWWSIAVEAKLVRIAWSSSGGPEQRHDRALGSHEAALAYADMQIEKQRERGYVEVAPVVAKPAPEPEPDEPVDNRPRTRSIRFEIAAEQKTSYRRYPKPARFVEYEQHDAELVELEGELATPDQARRKTERFRSISDASDAYDEAVRTLREDGWRQVRSSEAVAAQVHPELEAQCWAAPDDPVPWAVYADWLQMHGDPLGEIAARPTEPRLLHTHLEDLGIDFEYVVLEREHGFPRQATITHEVEGDGDDPTELARIAKLVMGSSVGRFVDRLRFGLAAYSRANDWSHTLRALAETPQAERLRELRFDAYEYTDCEISWATMGDLTGLFEPFRALEVLHLKSGAGGTLGELDLPSLRTFIRESGGLSDAELASIVEARWPALQHLEIWFGSPQYGATSTVDSILPLLDGKRLPRLRHLGIVNCAWVEDAIAALAGSRLLRQLHSLDLSKGILARRGVALLREHAAAFRHLASIDLTENLLLPKEAAQIREVLDNVIVCDQRERDLEDYEEDEAEGEIERYVAVGE